MPTLSAAQVAALVKQVGFPQSVHVTMVAIAKAESGFRTDAVSPVNKNGTRDRGLFQINDVHKKDRNKLVSDALYNAQVAYEIYKKQGLKAWSTYNNGAWKKHQNEAQQGVAQAASVNGSPAVPGAGGSTGSEQQGITYGPPGPAFTAAGIGPTLQAAEVIEGPLADFWIRGTKVQGDFANAIIGAPHYEAGIDMVPHVAFTIADPDGGNLLYSLDQQGYFWSRGGTVEYQDLTLKMDEIKFEGGAHMTGQLTVTAADDIVYRLMNLKGPRTAAGISATEWIAQELQAVGLDPAKVFLGESVPTQSMIARDESDQSGNAGTDQEPSAWTTIVRLAKELGKRVFISGKRLVFGSAAFAMQWAQAGVLQIDGQVEALNFLVFPTGRRVTVGERSVIEVTGRIPLQRAKYFRPGARVSMKSIASIASSDPLELMVSKVSHDLGTDVDGAEVTMMQPVDPPPQPPPAPTAAGTNAGSTSASGSSGGGGDGQIDKFVALALQQAGKKYVFGAEAKPTDPNPGAFDCSELVEWCANRVGIKPKVPDGSSAQKAHCKSISVAQAIKTKGALLFVPGHVAISLGNGKTIEAMNSKSGIKQGNASGRFTSGGLIPGAQGYK